MKTLGLLMVAFAAFSMAGCGDGGTSAADEAKLKQALSKPPSVPSALRHPGGAKAAGKGKEGQPGAPASAPSTSP